MDCKIWTPFSCLDQPFLQQCRLAYVFGRNGHDALFITAEKDSVIACGSNLSGCLGVGTNYTTLKPMSVSTLCGNNLKGLSSGFDAKGTFVVAYTYTGKVYAWGKQIGFKSSSPLDEFSSESAKQPFPIISTPKLVSFPYATEISEVACGTSHCLALSKDGKVYSWGSNNVGQLGNDSQVDSVNPILIKGHFKDQRVVKISCGNNFSVVALDNEQVYAWGDNSHGQVGFDSLNHTPYFLSPVKIRGLNDIYIKELICGKAHVLLLTNVGVVYGWGKNTRGELGRGDDVSSFPPEPIRTEEKLVDFI